MNPLFYFKVFFFCCFSSWNSFPFQKLLEHFHYFYCWLDGIKREHFPEGRFCNVRIFRFQHFVKKGFSDSLVNFKGRFSQRLNPISSFGILFEISSNIWKSSKRLISARILRICIFAFLPAFIALIFTYLHCSHYIILKLLNSLCDHICRNIFC